LIFEIDIAIDVVKVLN